MKKPVKKQYGFPENIYVSKGSEFDFILEDSVESVLDAMDTASVVGTHSELVAMYKLDNIQEVKAALTSSMFWQKSRAKK